MLPLNPTELLIVRQAVPRDARAHVVKARASHRRAYVKWTAGEDALLRRAFMDGHPTALIAQGVERNAKSVEGRLKRLGLVVIKPPKPTVQKTVAQKKLKAPRVALMPVSAACVYCAVPMPSSATHCPNCGASSASGNAGRLATGTKLRGGLYSIGRVIGEGGFGITYMGANVRRGERVAIKEFFPSGATRVGGVLLPPRGVSAAEFAAERVKCLEEAQRLGRFKHSGIVGVSDAFEENGTVYLVMEYLHGATLEETVRVNGSLEASRVARIAAQLLEALERVHMQGLLHRDIKPDNVMLCGERAVLIDFGAAREFQSQHSQRHSLILTPGYAPLEQYGSQVKRSASSDLYALAGTLYFALTARVPPDALQRIHGAKLEGLAARAMAAAPGLCETIIAGLNVRIEERPQSAREMAMRIAWQPQTAPISSNANSDFLQRVLRLLKLR
jgi:serine/threonine protein kinase